MNPENAIEVNNITKKFKVYLDKGKTLKEMALFKKRRTYEERLVLKGISFEVKKGEAIGLIGHNGCGKSTTLKLLTKIMYPDSGNIEMRGRVSSLIELGAGFHPDMSGRQNIYTNASIFGLTRKEIDSRINDIIAFSELEEFIDNPVRTYSSGMYMRLAFSVAINVDADILLIDEILAVGDVNFQAKCFNKLREVKANGTTIVIVSHSLGQIEQICDRTIWIHNGFIKAEGTPRDIHPEYMDFMGQKRHESVNSEQTDINVTMEKDIENKRWGNGHARITKVSTYNAHNRQSNVFSTGENIRINIDYEIIKNINNAVFGIGIFRSDGLQCYGTNTYIDKVKEFDLIKDGRVSINLKDVQLLPGIYLLDIAIQSDIGIAVDYYREAHKFEVYSHTEDIGVMRVVHEWII